MAGKRQSGSAEEASQVFRQFAWHLAGSLAATTGSKSGSGRPGTRPTATKPGGKR